MDLSEQEVALVLRRAATAGYGVGVRYYRTRVDEIEVALEAVLDDLEGGTRLT